MHPSERKKTYMDAPCKVEDDLMECKTEIGQQMEAMHVEMAELKASVAELIDLFNDTQGFARTIGKISRFVRGLALLSVALGAVYAFFSKVKL